MSEIKVYCSNCSTEYEVPEEMLGQEAECAVCNQTFVVEIKQEEESSEGEGTNTVKISRSGIGMMPTVEDTFRVNLVDTPTAGASNASNATEKDSDTAEVKTEAAPKKKSWQFWKK